MKKSGLSFALREVLQELQGWRTGSFRFEPLDISDEGGVEVPVKGFVVPEGFAAQEACATALESLVQQGKVGRRLAEALGLRVQTAVGYLQALSLIRGGAVRV